MTLTLKISEKLVVIIIQLNTIYCVAIKQGSYKKYSLLSLYTLSQRSLIASSGILLNTTWIGTTIKNFLKKYQLENAAITVICDDTIIPQGYVSTLESSPHRYVSTHLQLPHHVLNTIYLYPHGDRFLSWWSRVPYALITQIHLIAYTHQLNIININASLPGLLETYKTVHGKNFRPLQLADDLHRSGYDIAKIIHPHIIQQFFEISSHMQAVPHSLYATILGAVLYETEAL